MLFAVFEVLTTSLQYFFNFYGKVVNLTNSKAAGRINPVHHTAFCKTLRSDTLLVISPHISRLHSTHYQTKATIRVNVFFIKLLVLS